MYSSTNWTVEVVGEALSVRFFSVKNNDNWIARFIAAPSPWMLISGILYNINKHHKKNRITSHHSEVFLLFYRDWKSCLNERQRCHSFCLVIFVVFVLQIRLSAKVTENTTKVPKLARLRFQIIRT